MKINSNYNYGYNTASNPKPAFRRNLSEHASWGAKFIKETQKADFKLFTFPDSKMVFVEIAKKAAQSFGNIRERIVQILAAQGSILTIQNILAKDEETAIYPMEPKGNGVFEAKDIDTEENAQYRYIVVNGNNNINIVKDPYAKKQPDINGWSEIYNSDNYEWKCTDWLLNNDSRRIIRKPNEPLRGLDNLIIEEINIPTLSKEGSFEKAKEHIDHVAEKGIATAIEIMPLENTYSFQWGYDGVDKFAINEKMGTPAQFKDLVDYAHSKGLNVIMDMVPNHVGPDGNYLSQTGPYIKYAGQFGDVPNFEGKDNKYVRDWMTNAALWWVNEFKVDGLRLDMTKYCESDWLLKQIIDEVNHHNPEVFIIAEDGRENLGSVTTYSRYKTNHENTLDMIDQCVDNIAYRNWPTYPYEIGFDSEWDFPLMHELKDSILNPDSINMDRLDTKISNSHYRVKYVMSHDEIGNLDGTRLIPKVITNNMFLFDKVKGYSDAEKGQNAAQLGQKLAELYLTEDVDAMSNDELNKKARSFGLANGKFIYAQDIKTAFDTALAKQRLALGTILTIPGPKMFFQGDDEVNMSHFKFFREFSSDSYKRAHDPNYINGIKSEKGYDTIEALARQDSLLHRVSPKDKQISEQMVKFTQDLSKLVSNSAVLRRGEIINTYKDTHHKVHTHHLKLDNEEVLVIKNFGANFHKNEYGFANFPTGNWTEIFNSDRDIYGGSDYINESKGSNINSHNQGLNLAPNAVIILKRVS